MKTTTTHRWDKRQWVRMGGPSVRQWGEGVSTISSSMDWSGWRKWWLAIRQLKWPFSKFSPVADLTKSPSPMRRTRKRSMTIFRNRWQVNCQALFGQDVYKSKYSIFFSHLVLISVGMAAGCARQWDGVDACVRYGLSFIVNWQQESKSLMNHVFSFWRQDIVFFSPSPMWLNRFGQCLIYCSDIDMFELDTQADVM